MIGPERGRLTLARVSLDLQLATLAAAACLFVNCWPAEAEPLTAREVGDIESYITSNLKPAYGGWLAKTGSTLVQDSPEWSDSLHRTVTALMSGRPADCLLAIWITGGCGHHVYDIPSEAMLPTILDRDVVSTLPPSVTRPIRRGDIVAYRVPPDPNIYMHRVIGLAGDRIRLADGVVEIDGQRLKRKPTGAKVLPGDGAEMMATYDERLPDGRTYRILWPERALKDVHGARMAAVVVPPGHYFLMGDDRSLSLDSRPLDGHGMPAATDILGIARTVILSRDPSRIGKAL